MRRCTVPRYKKICDDLQSLGLAICAEGLRGGRCQLSASQYAQHMGRLVGAFGGAATTAGLHFHRCLWEQRHCKAGVMHTPFVEHVYTLRKSPYALLCLPIAIFPTGSYCMGPSLLPSRLHPT